jgi:hypothetical protein
LLLSTSLVGRCYVGRCFFGRLHTVGRFDGRWSLLFGDSSQSEGKASTSNSAGPRVVSRVDFLRVMVNNEAQATKLDVSRSLQNSTERRWIPTTDSTNYVLLFAEGRTDGNNHIITRTYVAPLLLLLSSPSFSSPKLRELQPPRGVCNNFSSHGLSRGVIFQIYVRLGASARYPSVRRILNVRACTNIL